MVTKKSVIILLFVIAALLVLFSVGMNLYASGQSSGQGLPNDGGQIQLAVLPQENSSTAASAGNNP